MLTLPNEILDIIIRLLVGEPLLNPPSYLQPIKPSNDIRALRLVHRRLAVLGGPYLHFRHRVTSERQLTYETTSLTEVQKIYREQNKQLDLDGLPILYWLKDIKQLYPQVTHMTLTSIRLSNFVSAGCYSASTLYSVKHLSIQVTTSNEAYISHFLRYFPELVTLVLDSNPNDYAGMDHDTMLSLPVLPRLKILCRPPLKRTFLSFRSDSIYASSHQHYPSQYSKYCTQCSLWLINTESAEKFTVKRLAWLFPSLREVLIPRLVFDELTPITFPLPVLEKDISGYVDGVELARRRRDVAIWLIEPDSKDACRPDCCWPLHSTNRKIQAKWMTSESNPNSLYTLSEDSMPGRQPFCILSPDEYNQHNQYKLDPRYLPTAHSHKFWRDNADLASSAVSCPPSAMLFTSHKSTIQAHSIETRHLVVANPRIFSPWDL
ncbi:hypothetical protein CPB86DRAFT_712698 [Serendipita vermifera]|nr:hypothetical protein CPB86DRAFT_712698 [Serendipita vermifera]